MPQRGPAQEEQDAIHRAQTCILDCHVDQLITETKFLRVDSLAELLKVGPRHRSMYICGSHCSGGVGGWGGFTPHGPNCFKAQLFVAYLCVFVVRNNNFMATKMFLD